MRKGDFVMHIKHAELARVLGFDGLWWLLHTCDVIRRGDLIWRAREEFRKATWDEVASVANKRRQHGCA